MLPAVLQKVPFPVIASPMFIISNPKLVIEQCKGWRGGIHARPECAPGPVG